MSFEGIQGGLSSPSPRFTLPPTTRSQDRSPERASVLPVLFSAGLLAFALHPTVRETPRLLWSFLGTGTVLVAWTLALLASTRGKHRSFTLEIALRKQHYVQACAHTLIFLAGKQGADHRSELGVAVRARLRPGLA